MNFMIGEKKQESTALLPLNKQVHISLETQEEIDQLYALLNYRPITEALSIYNNDWFRLKKALIRSPNCTIWHNRLCKGIRN